MADLPPHIGEIFPPLDCGTQCQSGVEGRMAYCASL